MTRAEFHHAVTDYYQRIIDYFKPQFLLGLTATPERMDGRNIYELCDYNVPYEITLKDAINRGMLVPFHYYGIYDKTDYSGLRLKKGHYEEQDLNRIYIENEGRNSLIYGHYMKYRSKRALGFCCSRLHAEEMAKDFSKRGIPSVAVYSNGDGEFSQNRHTAIRKLKSGEIKVIFSVDMFNEGVDITSVDMVMFLRPTESLIVFLQQLGRGLRRCRGKEYLNVLDFIGNYEKAGRAPYLLSGKSYSDVRGICSFLQELDFPDDCMVDFDLQLIDLFQEMAKRGQTIREQIQEEYLRVKELLEGKVPSRMELKDVVKEDAFRKHMKDIIEYRTMEYYRRRYTKD